MSKKDFILYVRNFIFGAEDSLVSTVSMLAGIVAAGVSQREIIISGLVLIAVEAFSMSVGSFLSERTTEESSIHFQVKKSKAILAAIIMLFSYFLSGLIPLLPYLILHKDAAFWCSIAVSLLALLLIGVASARILKTNIAKSAFRMVIIGGFAVILGIIVGFVIS